MSSEHESAVIFGSRADLRAERKRKRDESGDWDMLSHPDLRSILQQKERLGNILMKYYPTLLHLPADAMPETPPVGNHSYTVKPAGCCKIMVKLDNSSFVVKGLGQSQKFGFGMKFYVGSADDLPLSERVMPGLLAVAWAEAQVLARKWQQKKDSEQPDVSPSCDATTEPSPKDASSGSETTLAWGQFSPDRL